MIFRTVSQQIQHSLKSKKSVLLLGPRQTGKSTLCESLNPSLKFNLAQESMFLNFVRDPSYLESRLAVESRNTTILVDEVQRVPSLLNTVQYLIDQKKGFQFILTGSSARKLKRGKANLLPGRIHDYQLGPITSSEMGFELETDQVLKFGTLPGILTEETDILKKKILKTYAQVYLNEEIKAEALTKNIEAFARFLFVIAAQSSQFLDLNKISSQSGVPRQTVQRFFEILGDTLIVKRCPAFASSEKKRLVQHPRFFFFDNGVLNGLLANFNLSLDRRGVLFENLFFNQLYDTLSAAGADFRLSTYRTSAGAEVDFILELDGRVYALECKTGFVRKADLRGFESFETFYGGEVKKIVVSDQQVSQKWDQIHLMPWQNFLASLKL